MTAAGTTLDALLEGFAAAPRVPVAGLALDGRRLRAGEAFVALRGRSGHGLDFVSQAIARGARAVLWDPAEGAGPGALPGGVAAVAVPALRQRLGEIAARCFGHPAARLSIAGVTGTNGKTTCAWLLALASARLGRDAGYLGTLGCGRPPALAETSHTTPDVLALHGALAGLVADGVERAVLEVSSHALDQDRLAGVPVAVAAFTNLTRDHLDYHGTLEAYAAAKRRLFELPGVAHAVINVGDPVGLGFARGLPAGVELTAVSVGAGPDIGAARRLRVTNLATGPGGLVLAIEGDFGVRELRSPLVGAFNAENLAVVLGMLLAWGHPVDAALEALAGCGAPPGRMESFRTAGGALAIVDYAHTPDALAKVLEAARRHAAGRLAVVFGCGGERDAGKRAPMGAIAERLADLVYVTDDNPRGEDPQHIVAAILAGMNSPGRARVERDRAAAIAAAVASAGAGDVVVIAGKGHERVQVIGREARPFSDRDCLLALGGVAA
ncbi:MAG: UDP-N-acetylmuramoyl-L-alanyl-D-glutamate--2,6-diaminopimelate ligase [Steroidobacteraceae bacterium]|nr:UDP-N-acetylmuramoyl-L-alanyl-D-glutamate--2,6-diaminopimelate ligase [Steroidobacteraceae bacterium]